MTTWKRGARTSSRRSGTANTGNGVVILTDMFGGTPSNLAISVMKTVDAEVIAGMNLPMLVKLARVRGDLELKPAVTHGRRSRAQIHQCRQRVAWRLTRSCLHLPMDTAVNAGRALAQQMTIVNRKGLHARASARFVRTAECFDAEIKVTRDGPR